MLEDDRDRLSRFTKILEKHLPSIDFRYWRSAPEFIAAYAGIEQTPRLIALDHDLFTESPDDPDPGDGRDVARFLAAQTPRCPILIHSSNAAAADSMLLTLQDASWNVHRIAPLGSDWIEAYWFPTVRDLL